MTTPSRGIYVSLGYQLTCDRCADGDLPGPGNGGFENPDRAAAVSRAARKHKASHPTHHVYVERHQRREVHHA